MLLDPKASDRDWDSFDTVHANQPFRAESRWDKAERKSVGRNRKYLALESAKLLIGKEEIEVEMGH
jgi:hypothetical protein